MNYGNSQVIFYCVSMMFNCCIILQNASLCIEVSIFACYMGKYFSSLNNKSGGLTMIQNPIGYKKL
uniref:Putative ovule protein n=1 Tax=Solanum chacoense TaxID=4108 RepID=A0A0V0GTJ3_SOLCH